MFILRPLCSALFLTTSQFKALLVSFIVLLNVSVFESNMFTFENKLSVALSHVFVTLIMEFLFSNMSWVLMATSVFNAMIAALFLMISEFNALLVSFIVLTSVAVFESNMFTFKDKESVAFVALLIEFLLAVISWECCVISWVCWLISWFCLLTFSYCSLASFLDVL